MDIREALSSLPYAGSFAERTMPVLGTVKFKRLSVEELMALPDQDSNYHALVAVVHDKDEKPVFADIHNKHLRLPAIYNALSTENNKINSNNLAELAKN